MAKYLWVAVGGAVGSVLRFAVQGWVQRLADATFPVGTLAVNVVGCGAAGALAAMFAGPILVREEYRMGLLIGVLGGFTTFSTFGLETFYLANESQFRLALTNVALSCGLGCAGTWIGFRLAEWWFGV
jgi:CrcB protein